MPTTLLAGISAVLLVLAAVPQAAPADTAGAESGVTIDIDTFGLPSSLTILEGERKKEDFELKESARSKLILATREFFSGDYDRSHEYAIEGIQKGFYQLPFMRLQSRLHFLMGNLEQSISIARDVAGDSHGVESDADRYAFLTAVDRYLNLTFDTKPMSFRSAAVVRGDVQAARRFITPLGVCVDRFGRILQTSFGTNSVVIFSKGLEYVMNLQGISNPFDIAVDQDGMIYVTSFGADRVHRFDRDGKARGTFGRKGSGPGEFFGPEGIAISPDRYIYVIDAGNHRIQKFTSDGEILLSFGSRGDAPGKFMSPRSLLIETSQGADTYNVLVMSQEGNILQRFDPFGNFLGVVSTPGVVDPRDFDRFGRNGYIFGLAGGGIVVLEDGSDTPVPLRDEKDDALMVDGMGGLAVDDEAGLVYVSGQTASELHVFRPRTLEEKTLVNISDLDFTHYPYIAATLQVTTGEGDPITGLTRRNFAVDEENHRAKVISVKPATQTGLMTMITHLDASSALDRRMILVKSFLSDLSLAVPPGTQLAIRKGSKQVQALTDNPYLIRKGMDRMSDPADGFLARDIYESIRAFKGMGQKNLVLITARDNDISPEQFASIFLHMMNRGISLYVLQLSDRQLPLLKTLCRRTGGVYSRLRETSIDDFAFRLSSSRTASYYVVYASPYGQLQTNISMDVTIRLFYLTDKAFDTVRYFAP